MPVILKNASPKTPIIITTLAARSKIGAEATSESPNDKLAKIFCKFAIPSGRKLYPDHPGSGSEIGFSSKYDFSKSLTFLPAKSAVLMLEKTSSLKKETKLSSSAKNIRFTITRSIIA